MAKKGKSKKEEVVINEQASNITSDDEHVFKVEESPMGFVTGTNIPRTRTKVAIVGFAPSSMSDVQFLWDDPDMEIWGLNQLYMAFPPIVEHATRWFQIHHKHTYNQTIHRDHEHHKWLGQQTKFPIYMQNRNEDIPMSIPFIPDIRDWVLNNFRRYFTNSISWEIALATLEGFKEIHILGVDMAQDSEYTFERPSVEYAIGRAEGAGIKVVIPEKSDLCKSMYLYPFEDTDPFRVKCTARREELRMRVGQTGQQEQMAHDQRLQLLGALDNMNYIEKTWGFTLRNPWEFPDGLREGQEKKK